MNSRLTFTLCVEHLQLAARFNVRWESEADTESGYGVPQVDGKRPYGNSDVAADLVEILGDGAVDAASEEQQAVEYRGLHDDMRHATEIILQHGHAIGEYVCDRYERVWFRVEEES